MSSNRRRPDRRLREWLHARSLRTKLIAVLVGALAVICLIVGVVTELALSAHLVGQLDGQVRAAAVRVAEFARSPDGPPPHRGDGPANPGEARGLVPGTVTAIVADGQLHADLQSATAEPEPLPAQQHAIVMAGLPLDGVRETRWRVGLILAGVSWPGCSVWE